MKKMRILLYVMLFMVIFLSLFFIMGQNQEYKEVKQMENKLYGEIQKELSSYHEGLYQIEESKKTLSSKDHPKSYSLEIGTTTLSSPDSRNMEPPKDK